MKIGFITANFVARDSGYNGSDDWAAHDQRTRAEFDLADTREWLDQVAEIGFDGVSVWTAHCWYHSVSDEQADALAADVAERDMEIYSYGGGLGRPPEDDDPGVRENWERTFDVAQRLGANWLVGGYDDPDHLPVIEELVEEYDIGYAYENHPESSAEETLEQIAGYEESMGICFDTGWAGTQGYNGPAAIRAFGDSLTELHLKDVKTEGEHHTCTLGEGVVDVKGCVTALEEIGYDGWLTIEHEPYDHDPMADVQESYRRVQNWLADQ